MRATFEQLWELALKPTSRKWDKILEDHGWTLAEWYDACESDPERNQHLQEYRKKQKQDRLVEQLYRDHGGEG